MRHGSLFSGIGGFDLAAEWMGWDNVFHCELDPFGQRVLKHYWPKAISYADITKTDFTIHRGAIDILSGGFPCQDASNAHQTGGGQKGIAGERTGLVFEFFRAIDEIRPQYIVAENVTNILKINKGRDFAVILTELAGMGYDAQWRVCYASEVGAPHRRGRLYLVAYSISIRIQGNESFFSLLPKTPNTQRRTITGTDVEINADNGWLDKSPTYIMDYGLSGKLDLANTIKSAGNAIVPQVAHQIFKAIEYYNIKSMENKFFKVKIIKHTPLLFENTYVDAFHKNMVGEEILVKESHDNNAFYECKSGESILKADVVKSHNTK